MVKIAIYGAGAMGTVLGALLSGGVSAKSGEMRVDLVSRNRAHIQAMKENGAAVECIADGNGFAQEVNALFPEEMTEKYDVIFLMTKQKDNPKTAGFLRNFLSEEGIVCTAQNGLPEAKLAEVLGQERVYGGICAWGATFVSAGKVQLTSRTDGLSMEIGCYAGKGEKTALLKKILEEAKLPSGAGISVTETENLIGSRWSKLSINAAFSGLSVVTGLTFGEIAGKLKMRKIALEILRECFAVAKAAKIRPEKLQGHDMEKLLCGNGFFARQKGLLLLPIAMRKHKKLLSGMLKDVQSGKKCEIDYIDGVVSEYGKRYGADTPYVDKLIELVHGIENGLYEISDKNTDFFL